MDLDLQRLAPHLVAQARRGIVGSSRYAKNLAIAVFHHQWLKASLNLWQQMRN